MNPYSIFPLLSAVGFLSLGILAFVKGREHFLVRGTFLLECTVTFWWQFNWFVLFNIKDNFLASIIAKTGYSGIIFIPIAYLHFYHAMLNKPSKWIKIYYVIGFFFLIFLWKTDFFISGTYKFFWGYYPKASIIHPLYLLYLTILSSHCFYTLISAGKAIQWKGLLGNQVKYLALALFLYSLASSDFIVNYGIEFYPLGAVFVFLSLIHI